MTLSFYEESIRQLEERIKIYRNTITSGAVQSMEQYRDLCGRTIGLHESKDILKELMKNFIEPNYLDEPDNII